MINDLHDFVKYLFDRNRLITVSDSVDTNLEITAFTDRSNKDRKYDSKALLFTRVNGYKMPVVTNMFGSLATLRELLSNSFAKELLANIGTIKSEGKVPLLKGAKLLMDTKPKVVESQLHKYQSIEGLDKLPILKMWPNDAGRYITLPLVVTESPKDKSVNVGIYRMQVFDNRTTGMHWQTQKGGAMHAIDAEEKKTKLNVSVVLGTDPYNILAAATPLPIGMNEFSAAGAIRGAKTILMKNGKYPKVPLNSEIVINGYVDPKEKRMEGPFGDHTGYYSIPEQYPVFHIEEIYAKNNAYYPASVVGHPWHEDAVIFQYMTDFMMPIIKSMNEAIVDLYLPPEGLFSNMCFVSIKKRFPGEAKKVMFSILGNGQLSFTKIIAVFDDDINIRDFGTVMWALATRVEPERDIQIIKDAAADSLDHTTNIPAFGSKLLIDATKKRKDEGYMREWPDTISLPKELLKEVEKKWESLKS